MFLYTYTRTWIYINIFQLRGRGCGTIQRKYMCMQNIHARKNMQSSSHTKLHNTNTTPQILANTFFSANFCSSFSAVVGKAFSNIQVAAVARFCHIVCYNSQKGAAHKNLWQHANKTWNIRIVLKEKSVHATRMIRTGLYTICTVKSLRRSYLGVP